MLRCRFKHLLASWERCVAILLDRIIAARSGCRVSCTSPYPGNLLRAERIRLRRRNLGGAERYDGQPRPGVAIGVGRRRRCRLPGVRRMPLLHHILQGGSRKRARAVDRRRQRGSQKTWIACLEQAFRFRCAAHYRRTRDTWPHRRLLRVSRRSHPGAAIDHAVELSNHRPARRDTPRRDQGAEQYSVQRGRRQDPRIRAQSMTPRGEEAQ